MNDWADFFVAQVGASGALAGLVIVAISINLSRIVAFPWLPGRAAETLVAPTGVLIVSTYALVPVKEAVTLGVELLCVGAAMWLIPTIFQFRAMRAPDNSRVAVVRRFFLNQASSLPVIGSAYLILVHDPDALYWLVPGVTFSLIATVINAWVLLIEILR